VRYASLPSYFLGKDFALAALVKTFAASARLYLDDGKSKTYSAMHPGDNVARWLIVPKVLHTTLATKLSFGLDLGAGAADLQGAMLVPGAILPILFAPAVRVDEFGRLLDSAHRVLPLSAGQRR
jgi:hypothetical protein